MLRRLGIRGKVLAALGVPMLVLMLFVGLLSWQSLQSAETAREATNLFSAFEQSRRVAVAIGEERAIGVQLRNAPTDDATAVAQLRGQYQAAREATEEAIAAYKGVLVDVDLTILGEGIAAQVRDLTVNLASLAGPRLNVDSGATTWTVIFDGYTAVIADAVDFPAAVAANLDDRYLAELVTVRAMVAGVAERYGQEQTYGEQILQGEPTANEVAQLTSMFPVTDSAHADARSAVADLQLPRVSVPNLGGLSTALQGFAAYRTLIATGDPATLETIDPAEWDLRAQSEVEALEDALTGLQAAADTRADSVANNAVRTATLTIGGALAAVVLSLITAFAVARQIINPLRRLTEAAGQVRDELPHLVQQVAIPGQGPDLKLTQIPVRSRDEVGRLAAAFNEVNATTIEVAQEQAALRASIAEMFVNVARRDQVLLNRQLSFIDALERSEEDPKTLADLFRLDHLATRMRRNAESLLVLAGIDTGRRLRETLPTSDVIRTASSEIEHYERIHLDMPVDPMMLGHTALPTAHMLAELLENATGFSEPGSPVHVSISVDSTHVVISILDQGIGMTDGELVDANTRIRTTSAGDLLGSQRLGLYVVGHIATRLGAVVELSRGPEGTGTLATVRMPLVLFVDASALPATPPEVHGRVETFVRPEEAAIAAHDASFAPVGAQDVAVGAVGSVQNPAEPVDLAGLTDGSTERGLPRRRARAHEESGWVAGDSGSIPLATSPAALSGASRVSGAGEVWVPPLVQSSGSLTPRTPAEPDEWGVAAADEYGATTRRGPVDEELTGPTASGLPSRRPGADAIEVPGPLTDATTATGPSNVEGRTAIFTGFRSRRAELAAAAIQELGAQLPEQGPRLTGDDGADRLAASVTGDPGAYYGDAESHPEDVAGFEPPMVVPGLEEDEVTAPAPDRVSTRAAFAEATPVPTQQAAPEWEPQSSTDDTQEWARQPEPDAAPEWEPRPIPTRERAQRPVPDAAPWQEPVPDAAPWQEPAPAPFASVSGAPEASLDFEQLVGGPEGGAPAKAGRRGRRARREQAAAAAAVASTPRPTFTPEALGAPFETEPQQPPADPYGVPSFGDLAAPARQAKWDQGTPYGPPRGEPAEPDWQADLAPAAAAGAADWAPEIDWPDAGNGVQPAEVVPSEPAPIPEPVPSAAMFGTFDQEMTNMLAQRGDIAQQALAELNELSNYRPQSVARSGSAALVRRTPESIPAAPAISVGAGRQDPDADHVRSTLSSFQSGTTRGRQAAESGVPFAPQTSGDHAGSEEGPDARGVPVTTPDAEPNSRGTRW